jgi:glycosyltransferase involved in cell wall biosynthesis
MNNRKKLVIINGAQFGYSAGHHYYCKYLLKKFTIVYICFDRGFNRLSFEGVDVFYVPFEGGKLTRTLRFIKECIRQSNSFKPHLLLVSYFNSCLFLPVFCKTKIAVLDYRSGSLRKNRYLRGADNLFALFQSLFFNGVIIPSVSLRKKVHMNGKKCMVVPLGSEIFFSGIHKFNSLNLFYIGTFNNRNISETIKGLHLFLNRNAPENIDINYSIVGFGTVTETAKILKLISDLGLSGIVTFSGRKSNVELNSYFENANVGIVFVPITPWYDCQPATKLFEYMLSGMPVIATNTFENRSIVNNNNGTLINDTAEDFCNGLIAIYNSSNSFNSNEIRRSVESHTWENIVNYKLIPYLEKILE